MITFKILQRFDDANVLGKYWTKLTTIFEQVNKEIGIYIGGFDATVTIAISPTVTPAAIIAAPDFYKVPNREVNIWYQATSGIDANGAGIDWSDGHMSFGSYMMNLLDKWDGVLPTLSIDPVTKKATVLNREGGEILNGFLHETLHVMGFVSMIDFSTLKQKAGTSRLYDTYLQISANGDAAFTGPNAKALFGNNVKMHPQSYGAGSAFSHVSPDPQLGLASDTMTPNLNPLVLSVTDLDFAILKDIGYTINKTLVSADGHTFIPKPGLANITGTTGNDNIYFNGNRADYSIKVVGGSFVVTDKKNAANVDTLSSIENVKFNDVQVDLTVSQKAKSIEVKVLNSLVELYIAYFNRVPDGPGMSYWIGELQNGRSLLDISKNFYESAISLSNLTGYSKDMTNEDFVKIIYKNVLARHGATAPPEADVNYWAGNLTSGADTKGSLISTMLTSAHTFKGNQAYGWVADLLDNKITVGKVFSIDQGLSYFSGEETYTKAVNVALAITSTDTEAALKLIGIPLTDVLT